MERVCAGRQIPEIHNDNKKVQTTILGPIPLIEIYLRSKTVQDMSLFPKPPVAQRSLNVRHGNVPFFPSRNRGSKTLTQSC